MQECLHNTDVFRHYDLCLYSYVYGFVYGVSQVGAFTTYTTFVIERDAVPPSDPHVSPLIASAGRPMRDTGPFPPGKNYDSRTRTRPHIRAPIHTPPRPIAKGSKR